MDMIFETDRLHLREMTQLDYPALCKILQDKEVMYAYEHPFSDDEVQEWLNKQLKRYEEYGFGLWAVVLKATNEMIGQCGLTMQDWNEKQVLEIGYLFQKSYWHQGYALEAATACKLYAFDKLSADEVFSIIRDNNIASQNVAKRNGMTAVGEFVKHYYNIDMLHIVFSVRRSIEDNNKDKPMTIPKSIMTHYIINPKDSYFVNGSPPIETVEVVDYDCSWPEIYAEVASSIENELSSSVQKIDHIGSTAVPGLAAKPWIDIDLTVADPADEESYAPALEKLGFQLIVREPRFHEHRLFHLEKPKVNLHVFGPDCPETIRHLLFRDWLRQSPDDCQLYANAKLEAVKGCKLDIAKYHENKQKVVHEIYAKIFKFLGLVDNKNVQK